MQARKSVSLPGRQSRQKQSSPYRKCYWSCITLLIVIPVGLLYYDGFTIVVFWGIRNRHFVNQLMAFPETSEFSGVSVKVYLARNRFSCTAAVSFIGMDGKRENGN